MAIQRAVFQVSTTDAARQRALADQTQFVFNADDRDWWGIDNFLHTFDPVRYRAWLLSMRRPAFEGVAGIVAVPPAPRVIATAVGTGGPVASVIGGTVENDKVQAFLSRNPYVLEMRNRIDAQAPGVQRLMVNVCQVAFGKAFKALNLSIYGIKPLRDLAERLWGYYAPSSDLYWRGIPGGDINTLTRGGAGNSNASPWRREAAQRYNELHRRDDFSMQGQDYLARTGSTPVEPYLAVFGVDGAYDPPNYGCKEAGCYAPTGEVHTSWIQANGSVTGGGNPTNVDGTGRQLSWRGWLLDFVHWGGIDLFGQPVGGRERLFAAVPLIHYWEMLYWPQPEFADADGNWRNFIEWALSMSPVEMIRTVRVWVVQRNSQQAEAAGLATVSQLVGRAQQDEIAEVRDRDKTISLVTGVFGGAAVGLATAFPIAGLIVGAGALIGGAVARAFFASQSPESRRGDIYGQLMPAFTQFNNMDSMAALSGSLRDAVGWPVGAVPPGLNISQHGGDPDAVTDAMVDQAARTVYVGGAMGAGASVPPGTPAPAPVVTPPLLVGLPLVITGLASTVPVRVDAMPPYGGVFVDASTDVLDGRWEDSSERVWIVQVPRGAHSLRITSPTGPERTVPVMTFAGATTVRYNELAAPMPFAPVDTALQPQVTGGVVAGTGEGSGIGMGTVLVSLFALGAAGGGTALYLHNKKRRSGRPASARG